MNLHQLERMKRELRERYEADLATLERAYAIAQGLTPARTESDNGSRDLTPEVKEAVSQIPDNQIFTKRSITDRLRESDETIPVSAREAVGWILKKMSDAGEIEMKRVGKGKRPTEYTRPSSNNGNAPALSLDEVGRDDEPEALKL